MSDPSRDVAVVVQALAKKRARWKLEVCLRCTEMIPSNRRKSESPANGNAPHRTKSPSLLALDTLKQREMLWPSGDVVVSCQRATPYSNSLQLSALLPTRGV